MRRLSTPVFAAVFTLLAISQAATADDYVLDVEVVSSGATVWSLSSPVTGNAGVTIRKSVDRETIVKKLTENPDHPPVESSINVEGHLGQIVPDGVTEGRLHVTLIRADGVNVLKSGSAEILLPEDAITDYVSQVTLQIGEPELHHFKHAPTDTNYSVYLTLNAAENQGITQ